MGKFEQFAPIVIVSIDDPFDPTGENVIALILGYGVHVQCGGLRRLD
jgi:hypothetical protein